MRNDFEFDVREKKRIAAGAWHRKVGSKSRRCTLPYEHLTRAQLRAMNGPVKSYQLGRPMDAAQWCAMPEDLQRRYIEGLRQKYNVGTVRLAGMLGLSREEMKAQLSRLGLWDGRVRRMRAEQAAAWERWLAGGKEEA